MLCLEQCSLKGVTSLILSSNTWGRNWQWLPQPLVRTKALAADWEIGGFISPPFITTLVLKPRRLMPGTFFQHHYTLSQIDRGKTLDLRHSLGCSDKKYHGNQRAAAPILAHLQLSYIPRKRNTTWNTGLRLSLGLLEQLEPTAETVMLVVLLGFLAAISFLSVAGAKARTGLNRTIGAAT